MMFVNFCPGPPTIASVFIATTGDRDTRNYANHVIMREAHAQEEGRQEEGFPAALPEGVTPMLSASSAAESGSESARRAASSCSAGSSPLQVSAYKWNGGRCPMWDSKKLNWCPRYIRAFTKWWPSYLFYFPYICCCFHPLVFAVPTLKEVCCDKIPALCF